MEERKLIKEKRIERKERKKKLKEKIKEIIVPDSEVSSKTIIPILTNTGRKIEVETDYNLDGEEFIFFKPGEIIILPADKMLVCIGICSEKKTWFLGEGDLGITNLG